MSEFVYDKDEHIVINRKVYKRSDFKEEQVQAISVVNFADQQLASKAQELQILQLGRDQLVAQLIESLKELPVLHEISEEEEAAGEVQ